MMRHLLLLAAICGTISAALPAQGITINSQLAAYFPFDTCSAVDYSNNGGVGSLDSTIKCVCGVSQQGIEFDAATEDARFVGSVASVFNTSNFTVSFYMKPQATPTPGATQMVMSKQDTCSSKNAFWVRYRRQGQTSQSSNIISTSISQNDSLNINLTAKLDDDRCWYHVVIVRDGVKYSLYVDGVLRDQKSSAIRIDVSNNSALVLSKPKCPLDGGFFGIIDELRLYNRAYSNDEINRLLAINPDKIVNQDTVIYLGNGFTPQLSSTCAQSFIWSPLEGLSDYQTPTPNIEPIQNTTYVLRFNHPDGCAAYDTLVVNVIDPDTLNCSKLFLPNAFTPGFSEGRNDRFYISNAFAIQDFISFEIFDRWGGRMFSAETASDYWDGTFAGKPVNAGIYLYRVRYRCQGAEKVFSGTVTLLR